MLIKGCIQTEIIFADVMQKRQFVSEEYKLFVVGEIHFFCFKLAAGLVLSILSDWFYQSLYCKEMRTLSFSSKVTEFQFFVT